MTAKRPIHITIGKTEEELIERHIPPREFSEWVRNKIRQEFTCEGYVEVLNN